MVVMDMADMDMDMADMDMVDMDGKIQFHVYLIKVVISRTCLEPLVLFVEPSTMYLTSILSHPIHYRITPKKHSFYTIFGV